MTMMMMVFWLQVLPYYFEKHLSISIVAIECLCTFWWTWLSNNYYWNTMKMHEIKLFLLSKKFFWHLLTGFTKRNRIINYNKKLSSSLDPLNWFLIVFSSKSWLNGLNYSPFGNPFRPFDRKHSPIFIFDVFSGWWFTVNWQSLNYICALQKHG